MLCDRLEEKMKGTRVDGTIKHLFEGIPHTQTSMSCILYQTPLRRYHNKHADTSLPSRLDTELTMRSPPLLSPLCPLLSPLPLPLSGRFRSFTRCVHVDYTSRREESFYDLQLDVKGCGHLKNSFTKYIDVETLSGENQYEAEGHGKQDAQRGMEFLAFPPVLTIHLKRFEFDPRSVTMVKINDRFEYVQRYMNIVIYTDVNLILITDRDSLEYTYEFHVGTWNATAYPTLNRIAYGP